MDSRIKKKLKYEEEIIKKGTFYMTLDEFKDSFCTLDICKMETNYKTSKCKIKKEQAIKYQILELKVKERYERSYIQLYKKNLRIKNYKIKNFHHSLNADNNILGFIILAKSDQDKNGDSKIVFVDSIANYQTHIAIEVDLTTGTYFIFCDVNYRYNNQNHGYIVTCYHKSSKEALELNNITEDIKKLEKVEKGKSKRFLEKTICDYCLKKAKKFEKIDKGIKIYDIDSNINNKFPFDILCFINNTGKEVCIETEIKNGEYFCIYNEEEKVEKSTSVIKKIQQNRGKTVLAMRYNKKSRFKKEYRFLESKNKEHK